MFDIAEQTVAKWPAIRGCPRSARIFAEQPDFRDQLVDLLSACGFADSDGDNPELVILVHAPPRHDARDACALMAARPGPAILFVDETNDPVDRILAIEKGCDDFISWPCPPREFIARVKALQRRRARAVGGWSDTTHHDYVYDRDRREVFAGDGRSVRLTSTDDRVLRALMSAGGRPLNDAELQAAAYGGLELASRTAAVSAWRLQKKLRSLGDDEIVTVVRGRGHALAAPIGLRSSPRA